MNFKTNFDRQFTMVILTEEESNEYDVFKKFSEAKKEAIKYLDSEIKSLQFQKRLLQKMRKKDVE